MMTSLDCAALAVASLMLLVQLVATASVGLLSDKNDPAIVRPSDTSPLEIGGNQPGDGQSSPPSATIACSAESPSCHDVAVVTDNVGTNDNDVTVTSSAQSDNISPPLLRAQPINDLSIQDPGPSGQGQTSDCSSTNDGFFNDVTCQDTAGNTDQKTGKDSAATPSDESATPTRSSVDTLTSSLPLDKPSAPAQQGVLDSTGGIITSSTADNEYRYVDEEHEYFGIGGAGGMGDVRGPAEVDSEDDDMADYYDAVDYGRNNNYNNNMTSVDLAAGSSDLSVDKTQMIVDERNRDDSHILSDESTSAGYFDAGKLPYRDFDESNNNDQVAVNRAPGDSNGGTNDDDLWSAGVAVDSSGRTSVQQQQQQAAASWFDTHGEFSAFVVYTWLAVASASLVIVIIMIRYRHEVSMAVQYVKNGYIHTKQRANDVVEEANDLLSNAQV